MSISCGECLAYSTYTSQYLSLLKMPGDIKRRVENRREFKYGGLDRIKNVLQINNKLSRYIINTVDNCVIGKCPHTKNSDTNYTMGHTKASIT